MGLFKNFDRSKWLYNGLIVTFIILYAATAFVSFYHAITFFNIANAIWLSVILSFVAEIGQASVLFSILLSENKNKFLSWFIMIILTSLQVIGNVVSSFDWIVAHNDAGVDGFKRAILFSIQTTDPEMFRVIIAWISGALLPVIALSMTALVAQNLKLRDDEKNLGESNMPTGATISPEQIIDAKDIISEVSKFRPREEDFENMEIFLKNKKPISEIPEEELIEKKSEEQKTPSPPLPITEPHPLQSPTPEKKLEKEKYEPITTIEYGDDNDIDDNDIDDNDVEDQISQEDIEKIQEIASNIEDKSNKVDFLDETKVSATENLSSEPFISSKNGLVEGVVEGAIKSEEDARLERIRKIALENLKKK